MPTAADDELRAARFPGVPLDRRLLGYGATLGIAAAVGCLAGLGSIVFRAASGLVQRWAIGPGATFLEAVEAIPWHRRVLVPAAGALAAGLILHGLMRRDRTLGLSGVMEAVVLRRGPLRLRSAALRSLAALGIIGTGGSVGREGPIVELGAATGSLVAGAAGPDPGRHALLIACGAAGGMAAAYNAPLGAAVFVLELFLGSFSVPRMAPVVVASVSANTVARAVLGAEPVFRVPAFHLAGAWEFLPVVVLGLLAGFVGPLFLRSLAAAEDAFSRVRAPVPARMVLGGLLVGAIGIGFPEVWGNGYDAVNRILGGGMAVHLMALLLVLKVLATATTVGSGGVGGVFTPTLFVGAALGGLIGQVVHHLSGGTSGGPGSYALLGMAALVGSTIHAPVTAVLLLFEMTRDYDLVPPLMLATVISTILARHLYPWSHYSQRLRRRGVSLPRTEGEGRLHSVRAGDLPLDPLPTVAASEGLVEAVQRIHAGGLDDLWVTGTDGSVEGRIDAHLLVGLSEEDLRGLAIARDAAGPAAWVGPDASLAEALAILEGSGAESVPVVEGEGRGRPLGLLHRRRILEHLYRPEDAGP
jgi:CIC family chloride channel protein